MAANETNNPTALVTADAAGSTVVPYQLLPNPNGLGGYIANPEPTAVPSLPLNNNSSNVDLSQLVSPVVITEGLNTTPWYKDPGLITGNPRLRAEVQPVSFQVLLHDNHDFILSSGGATSSLIQVQLNASMKSINWSMKHLYNHQHTRTAHHITLWGMQADIIEGQCTTGIFMNQLGMTDYYSTRIINDKLKSLIGTLFSYQGGTTGTTTEAPLGGNDSDNFNNVMTAFDNVTTVYGPNGQSVSTATGNSNFVATMNRATRNNPNFSQTDAFRVAAQDAFMEFLALFKMNGNVWFWNKVYDTTNTGTNRDWDGVQAWSPVLGMSGAQRNGRNNDVMTRGGVIMSYRNFVYQGYFKALQWQIDARNPFKWDFSFVFQVEKTVGQQFIPSS